MTELVTHLISEWNKPSYLNQKPKPSEMFEHTSEELQSLEA